MKIIWSDFASETLRDILQYHKKVAGKNVTQKLRDKIFHSTKQLIKYPDSGQTEESLAELKEGHRYLSRLFIRKY